MLWKSFLEDAELLMQGMPWSDDMVTALQSVPAPPVMLYMTQSCSATAWGSSICSKVRSRSTPSPSSCSTLIQLLLEFLTLPYSRADSWHSLLAASYWHFSLVLLALLLLSFLSFLKPSWEDYLFRLCPSTAEVVNYIPKKKPQALKCRLSKLPFLWNKCSLFIIF